MKVFTRIRPVVVCPEMSSPAQSLASVMKVPSNSCLPWRAAFCSFCLGSLGENSGSLRQQMKAARRHNTTTASPARKVTIDESRKHHHFRTLRQSSMGVGSVAASSHDAMDTKAFTRAARALAPSGRQACGWCPLRVARPASLALLPELLIYTLPRSIGWCARLRLAALPALAALAAFPERRSLPPDFFRAKSMKPDSSFGWKRPAEVGWRGSSRMQSPLVRKVEETRAEHSISTPREADSKIAPLR